MAQTDEIPEDPKGLDSYGVVVKITDFHSGGPGLNYLLGAAVWCSGKPFIHPADHVLKHPWTLTRCSSTIIYEHTPSGSTKWLKKLLMVTSLDMVTQTFLGSTDQPSFNWRTIKSITLPTSGRPTTIARNVSVTQEKHHCCPSTVCPGPCG